MERKPIIKQAYQLLQKDLTLETAQAANALKEEQIIFLLEKELKALLNYDFRMLCNIMYRLDIDEKKFNDIITFSPPEKVAIHLAKEVWERELTKAKYRMKYAQHH